MRAATARPSKRRSSNGGGEASFRRAEENNKLKLEEDETHKTTEENSHKWVTICEALREFNCFLPCRSSCTNTTAAGEKESSNNNNNNSCSDKLEKRTSSTSSFNGRSCGAVFARWLVSLQDGEGKGREIELVVGEEEGEREDERSGGRSLRRRVFEGVEFKEEDEKSTGYDEVGGNGGGEGEEAGRVSICIPPKNALLLMRCRSDPVKMAALANRFWDPPEKGDENEEREAEDVNEEDKCEDHPKSDMCSEKYDSSCININGKKGEEEEETPEEKRPEMVTEEEAIDIEGVVVVDEAPEEKGENVERRTSIEMDGNAEIAGDATEEEPLEEDFEVVLLEQKEEEDEEKKQELGVIQSTDEPENVVDLEEKVEADDDEEEEENESHCPEEFAIGEKEIEKEEENEKPIFSSASEEKEEEERVAEGSMEEEVEEAETTTQQQVVTGEEKTGREEPKEEKGMNLESNLPDCLLLMMCEPKVSMEVSKETWVCSTDFIQWLPDRRRVNMRKLPEEPKKRPNVTAVDGGGGPVHNRVPPAQLMQPPRSSCSLPMTAAAAAAAQQSMASVIERKLVGTKPGFEPFVLTRCKSEPMSSAAKLAPDACFWKNRKLEPHRQATLGVGAAGVGF